MTNSYGVKSTQKVASNGLDKTKLLHPLYS